MVLTQNNLRSAAAATSRNPAAAAPCTLLSSVRPQATGTAPRAGTPPSTSAATCPALGAGIFRSSTGPGFYFKSIKLRPQERDDLLQLVERGSALEERLPQVELRCDAPDGPHVDLGGLGQPQDDLARADALPPARGRTGSGCNGRGCS